MTADDLKTYRTQVARLTQADMATRLGLSARQFQDLEAGKGDIRPIHVLALEFASLQLALERKDINAARPMVRRDALAFSALVRGE